VHRASELTNKWTFSDVIRAYLGSVGACSLRFFIFINNGGAAPERTPCMLQCSTKASCLKSYSSIPAVSMLGVRRAACQAL
jgi:hypothetical protein